MKGIAWRVGLIAHVLILALLAHVPAMADETILKLDRSFADTLKAKGAVAGMDRVYGKDVRLMVQGRFEPVDGKAKALAQAREFLKGATAFERTPAEARVLTPDQSAYTSGWWVLRGKTASGKARNQYGRYATVWTKESDGQWRVALDVLYRGRKPKSEGD